MRNPAAVEKMRRSRQGQPTFLSRGGNGQITQQQQILHDLTGLPMEHVIGLPKKWLLSQGVESPPWKYAVDLAHVASRTAIEVDGATHKTKKWRFLDQRKEHVLSLLGWSVLRFWNEEVDTEPDAVVRQILAYTTSRSHATTTTSPTECSCIIA